MNNKAAFFDFHRNSELETQSSEDAAITDFTVVTSCVVPDESEDAVKRKIKADQVREYIAAGKNHPLSLKQKFLNFINKK
ncbi:MAG: hypothetical protein ACYST9_05780 [Planctomycetota bacterium]|jgi:hypothetical protein